MFKKLALAMLFAFSSVAFAQTCTPTGGVQCTSNYDLWLLPPNYANWNVPLNANFSIIDTALANSGVVTWPTSGDLVLSNGTNSPAGLAPVNGDCVTGSGGAWVAGNCGGTSFTLTAATDIAAGTGVSVNSSGQAQQTWGPAPNVAGVVTLFPNTIFGGINSTNVISQIVPQDSTHFLAWGTSFGNTAVSSGLVAASISGDTITVGTPIVNGVTYGSFYTTAALSDSSFVTVVDNNAGAVAAGSISGLTITLGSSTTTGVNGLFFALNALSSNSFVLAGNDTNGGSASVAVGTVSGTTVTMGSIVTIGSGNITSDPQIAVLDSTDFVIAYNDGANNNAMTFVVGTVVGTVVTLGTPVALPNTAVGSSGYYVFPGYYTIESLSSSSFVCLYSNNFEAAPVGDAEAVVGTVALTVPTLGTPVVVAPVFSGVSLNYSTSDPEPSIAVIDGTHVAFGAGPAMPQVYTVSGTTLTPPSTAINLNASFLELLPIGNGTYYQGNLYLSPSVLPAAGTIVNSVVTAGSSLIFVDGNSSVFEVDQSTSTLSPGIQHANLTNYGLNPLTSSTVLAWFFDFSGNFQARVINVEPINATSPIGITAAGATSGNPVTITPVGSVSGLSGLTPGTQYYYNGDGTITAGNTGHPAGVALTSSTLAVH